jgi:hypothetical protein
MPPLDTKEAVIDLGRAAAGASSGHAYTMAQNLANRAGIRVKYEFNGDWIMVEPK